MKAARKVAENSLWTAHITADLLTEIIENARREGAEAMRERAAEFIATHSVAWSEAKIVPAVPGGVTEATLAQAIRDLPLEE